MSHNLDKFVPVNLFHAYMSAFFSTMIIVTRNFWTVITDPKGRKWFRYRGRG